MIEWQGKFEGLDQEGMNIISAPASLARAELPH